MSAMKLCNLSRMEIKLGEYAVGQANCLTDPLLVSRTQDYRRFIASRMVPLEPDRPIQDKLRSPRETLKTLYFAVNTYDLFPQMIEDALSCLDLDGLLPRPAPEDAAMLALDLEYVLQTLALPLNGVPDQGAAEQVVLYDAPGFRLVMRPSAAISRSMLICGPPHGR